MKKKFLIALVFACVISVLTVSVNAKDIGKTEIINTELKTSSQKYTYVDSGSTIGAEWGITDDGVLRFWSLSGGGFIKDYNINNGTYAPWTVSDYSSTVKTVEFSEGFWFIGLYAFYGMASIENVTFPDSMGTIRSSAFEGCTALQHITLNETLDSVGNKCFAGCTSLHSVFIPDLNTLGGNMFEGCTALREVTFAQGVSKIPFGFFANCTALETVTLPSTLTEIGAYAFENCTALKRIELPNGIRVIDNFSFKGCSSLMSIHFPQSVTEIGGQAFMNCSSLATVNFPDNCTYGKYCFAGCSSITSATLPMTVVPDGMFSCCISLKQVVFNSNTTKICRYAFNQSGLESIVLPNTLRCLEVGCFKDCTELTTVYFPRSCIYVENNVFSGDTAIEHVDYTGNWYDLKEQVCYKYYFGNNSSPLYLWPSGSDEFFFDATWHFYAPPMEIISQPIK